MELINFGSIAINQYLIKIEAGYLMIDTGYPDGYTKFLKKLKRNSLSLNDIKYIFLTHAHDDHVGFLKKILEDNPMIQVFISKETEQRLKDGHNRFDGGTSSLYAHFICNFMRLIGKGKHKFPSINHLNHPIYLDDPQFNFEKYKINAKHVFLPGHTRDNVGLIIEGRYLFCGDAAMSGPASKNNNILYIENKEDYILSWQRMIELNLPKIYPGHGKPFKREQLIKNYKKLVRIKIRPLKS